MDKEKIISERSKLRLEQEIKKRIQTTMIGSLSSIEKHFGPLWEGDEESLTPEQKMLRDIYDELRSEILDKGNDQIRKCENDLKNYDVNWNRYHINIPIGNFGQ